MNNRTLLAKVAFLLLRLAVWFPIDGGRAGRTQQVHAA